MFVLTADEKNGLASTPINWLKVTKTETGYYWPLYGLHFKLKNYVPLPVDQRKLKTEWRFVRCTILLNGTKFKTYQAAEKELLKILKEKATNESDKEDKLESEVESRALVLHEKESEELNEAIDNESVVVISDDEENELDTNASVELGEEEESHVSGEELNGNDKEDKVEFEVESRALVSHEEESEELNEAVDNESVVVVSDDEENELDTNASVELGEEEDSEVAQSEELESDEEDEAFGYLPLNFKSFRANETILKTKDGLTQLKEFYLKINQNSERAFFNELVKTSFIESFFLDKITFKPDRKRKNKKDWVGVFDETRLYQCLKKAVVKKLELKNVDDTELKKMFVTNFERIKRAIRARL